MQDRGSADVTIGIDLGTSGVAVVALGASGAVIARADNPVPLHTPQPGWTQQDPADWLTAVEGGLRVVAAAVGSARVAAIGLSGQMHGMVAIDAASEVVYPAILWNDGRTSEQVELIERRVGRDALVRRTGNRMVPGFQLPKVLWLRQHQPEAFARTRHVLFPKDYLGMHLTGRLYAEPADASGSGCFAVATGDWDHETLAALDLEPGLWPALVRSTQVVGELGAGMADRLGLPRGTPVVAGAGDNASAAVALGLSADAVPVQGSVSLGTSGVVQVPIAVPRPDPQGRVHLFADALGGYLLLGVTLAAAGSLRWYRDTVAPTKSFAELLSLAAESTPSAGGVTFLPYLAGERTPHMRADLRGSFQGLSLATTAADMVRAVVQGVAYSLRDALDVMRPLFSAGTGAGHDAPQRFLATGGGAASDMWLETLATLFGVPVERPLGDDGAAHQVGAAEGAAMLAWRALGVTVDTSPPGRHVFEPSTAAADELESGYARYLELSRRAQEESR